MPFKIVQTKPNTIFHSTVQLDLTRDTAILIRQSRKGSHIAHYESRLLQESLIPFVMTARGESDLARIRVYDEGSGVSGTKGPGKREKVRQLLEDIVQNLIGSLVLARVDRLFRDKHFADVSTFTMIAEKAGLLVVVPTPQKVTVYDMRSTDDLQRFQADMANAYKYITNQLDYMGRARDNKKSRGLYGGGALPLPYVLEREVPKEEQIPVVYKDWLEPAQELFKKFADFNFEIGRMARFIESKPYLFAYMPTSDLEIYRPVTSLKKVEGGYTISSLKSLAYYLSNLTLGGFAHGGKDEEGNILLIAGAFEAAIPLELLEPAYAAIKGVYLDGTPYTRIGSPRQYRHQGADIDGMLHGLLTSDNGPTTAFSQLESGHPIYSALKGGYLGQSTKTGLGRIAKAWTLPCAELDSIVLNRLIALAEYDKGLIDRIKEYFDNVGKDESTLAVLDESIKQTAARLHELSQTIALLLKPEHPGNEIKRALKPNDPLIKDHRELQATLHNLEKQRKEAAIAAQENPTKSIANFYHTLSHLRSEFYKRSPQNRKDIIRKLANEVKVNAISPHLFTLHIHWITPVASGREDVALFWRADPLNRKKKAKWSEEEETALRRFYPDSPQIELMQAIPTKSPGQIKNRASELGIRRDRYAAIDSHPRFWWTVCYADLQAAEQFTVNMDERCILWRRINDMAVQTKRGQLTENWFIPIDLISFSKAVDVTDMKEDGYSRFGG